MRCVKDPTSDNPYLRKGFQTRKEYLRDLAEQFGMSYKKVLLYADLFGPEEDFDALITSLEEVSYLEN